MGARARDRQQRAGARAGEGRDAGGAAGGARARAGRVRVKWARRGGLWGGGMREVLGQAEVWISPRALPDLLRGGDVCFRARSRSLLTGISPFSPGGHTAVGNLTVQQGVPPSRRETLLLRGHPWMKVSLK